MHDENHTHKIRPISLGFAIGVAEGLCLLVFAWLAWLGGYGVPLVHFLSVVMYGYAPTFLGGLIGGLWGLVDGFIFGIIVAVVYNCCACWGCRKSPNE